MAIVFTDSQNYTDIADAIRSKNGTSNTYSPSEMASAILAIPGGSVNNQDKAVTPTTSTQSVTYDTGYTGLGTVTVNAIPTGTSTIDSNGTYDITNYASVSIAIEHADYIKKYNDIANFTAFADESATSVRYGAFAYTSNLSSVSFPNVTSIGNYAFAYCYKLRTIYFPKVKSIATYAFQYCSSFNWALDSTKFPELTGTLNGYTFRGCQYLTGVDLPNVTSLGAQTFSACSRITTVNLPKVTSIGAGAFSYLTTCSQYSLPLLTYVASNAFTSNWALSSITLPKVTTISAYAFRYCSKLMSIYLTGSTVPTLNASAFLNMPLSSSVNNVYGSVFVPSSLYATYISATNWVTYKNRIVSIT